MVAEKHSGIASAELSAGALTEPPVRNRALLECLTPAERQVAVQVAQGLSNKEISTALGRAEPTIKHQISSAMQKLGAQSRCQLIVQLLR